MKLLLISLAVILLLALLAQVLASNRFKRDIKQLMSVVSRPQPPQRIDPAQLPSMVQKFIGRAGVAAGAERAHSPHSVHLQQAAEFRMGPDKPWQAMACEQVIALGTPGFVWSAEQRKWGFTVIRIMDSFVAAQGLLRAHLFGSIPVARFSGPEADQSELMRYLAELAWAPDAALYNPALRWQTVSEYVVELAADSNGGEAKVQLYLNRLGEVVEMLAEQRGSTENGVVIQRPWRGVFKEHREIGGRRIPTYGEVGYIYEDGYKPYWRGHITDYRIV